jgi:hypothetical protein
VGSHFLRDPIALEHVLKRGDSEAHFFGEAHQHQRFVGAVCVGVNETLPLEDFDERLELQIDARRQRVGIRRFRLVVVRPRLLVGLRACERVADDELDTVARRRIPERRVGLGAELTR